MSKDSRRKFLISMAAAAAIVTPTGAVASSVISETPQQKFGRLALDFIKEYRATNVINYNYLQMILGMVSGFDAPTYPDDLEKVSEMFKAQENTYKYMEPGVYSDPVFAIAHFRNILSIERIRIDVKQIGHEWLVFRDYCCDLILRA